MLHTLSFFLSSRCRLFHNAIFFGSCNIHILNTGCAKILKKILAPKGSLMFLHILANPVHPRGSNFSVLEGREQVRTDINN